jgi:hypothetical protein
VTFEKRLYTAKVHDAGRETIVRTLCVLVLIGITTTLGYSQETASDYVSPSEAVPRGKAPKMQVQLLNPGETTKQYAVIFYQEDEAISGLLEFAEKYQVTSAHFTAIGAVSGATLGWLSGKGLARCRIIPARFQPLPIRTAREDFPQAAHPVGFVERVMGRIG